MAYFRIEYFSQALCRGTSFEMFFPNDGSSERGDIKTLFLLHGYTGKAGNWVPEELANELNVAIVMPSAENSFYLNGISTGHRYEDMVAIELVDYVRKVFGLAMEPEKTGICGMSMGGYGALHTGLAHPDRFGWIGALSSALIVKEVAKMKPGESNPVANYEYYRECFGELDKVLESDGNLEVLIKKLKENGKVIPNIYMCCGTEDFLIENNRDFENFLLEQKVEHIYKESAGTHDMVFWSGNISDIVKWMFKKED